VSARADSLNQIEHEVTALIRRIRRVIGDRARALHPDLQPATYLLLTHIADRGPVRSARVVEAFGIDKGAVSRQVQHLAELGLVERTPDPADGRAALLSVTAAARERLADVQRERLARFEARLGGWSDAELRSFADALARYNSSLEEPVSQTAVSGASVPCSD
jgi:DNA-binding MarR family transcriptional regulator